MPTAKEVFEQWKTKQVPYQVFQYNPLTEIWKEITMSNKERTYNLVGAENNAKIFSRNFPLCLFSVSQGTRCLSLYAEGKCIWQEDENAD